MFKTLGVICYVFGILDVGLYVLGIADLTGVTWSPFVAFVLGAYFMGKAKGDQASATQTDQ